MRRLLILGLLLLSAVRVSAQEARDLGVSGVAPSSDLDAATAAKLTGAGILGGAVGLVGGAHLGALIAHNDNCADCLEELRGALVVGTAGEALLLPLGVHLANGSRGSYWKAALVSAGLAVTGVAIIEAAHWDPPTAPIVAVVVPIAQLVTSIAIERATDESDR
jgi:hypothetical protein